MPDAFVYRVRSASTGWGGAPGLNTFYFQCDDPGSSLVPTEAQDVADRVHAAWLVIKNIEPTPWSVTVSPEVDIINTDNGHLDTAASTTPSGGVGGSTGAAFGPQVAMICANYLTTGIIDGHRVRGRAFFGPSFNGGDNDGTPAANVIGYLQTALDALMGGTTGHPAQVVWSRRRGVSVAHPTGLGGSSHPITGVTIKDSYAVLTSRRQ